MARDTDLLDFVRRLGREFVRREMTGHAEKLRLYYLALKHGLAKPGSADVDVHWSKELVIDWLKILHLPPYENVYPVRPRRSACPQCLTARDQQSTIHTERIFPGGSKVRCFACGLVWLEED